MEAQVALPMKGIIMRSNTRVREHKKASNISISKIAFSHISTLKHHRKYLCEEMGIRTVHNCE